MDSHDFSATNVPNYWVDQVCIIPKWVQNRTNCGYEQTGMDQEKILTQDHLSSILTEFPVDFRSHKRVMGCIYATTTPTPSLGTQYTMTTNHLKNLLNGR